MNNYPSGVTDNDPYFAAFDAEDDEPEPPTILCSECYDNSTAEIFYAIIPQSTCLQCGRKCLGYQVS